MANKALMLALGISLIGPLGGCKEGHRHLGLDPGQCLVTNADGSKKVVPCADGQMNQPDATTDGGNDGGMDAKVPDSSVDAGRDAFVLPSNACADDISKTRPLADAGSDGGSTPVLSLALTASVDAAIYVPCTSLGVGPAFIQCVAEAIATAIPELSEDCPLCYGAFTNCAFANCASGGNDACLFANPSNPTAEELAECSECQCDSSCYADLDECSGLDVAGASINNVACVPSGDGCATDGANIAAAQQQLVPAVVDCLSTLGNNFSWPFVLCVQKGLSTAVAGLSDDCGVCFGVLAQCALPVGCGEACENLNSEACNSCLCNNGCRDAFDACSGFGTAAACVTPDAGVDGGGDGGA